MRSINTYLHASLGGILTPGDPGEYSDAFANGGWTSPYRSEEGLHAVLALMGDTCDLLPGRRTYDLRAGYRPTAPNTPILARFSFATG